MVKLFRVGIVLIEWELLLFGQQMMVFLLLILNLRPKGDYIHDIVTDKTYRSFQLSIEWNISEGGNSGIFWGVQEGENHNKPYSTGPEIQVLDNERHPDAKANPKFHQAGALYDMVQPSKDVCKPAGEWNHVFLL